MGALRAATQVIRRSGDRVVSGASKTIQTGVRKGTSPLSVAAGGAAGAYSYGQYTDYQEEQERSDRYEQFQTRVETIEQRYANGEISHAEMEQLKEEAREAYYASGGEDTSHRGLSWADTVSQMTTTQLLATAFVASLGVYFVFRPVAVRIATESPSVEELLG